MQEPQPMDWETYKATLPSGHWYSIPCNLAGCSCNQPIRHATFTIPNQAPDLTGEDESVDMREEPDPRIVDYANALASINMKRLTDARWSSITDERAKEMARETVDALHGKAQPESDQPGAKGEGSE